MNLQTIYCWDRDTSSYVLLSIEAFRRQNYDRGLRMFREMLSRIRQLMEFLLSGKQELQQVGISLEDSYLVSLLSGLMQAQEQEDYILMADLMELQIIPFLDGLQDMLRGISGFEFLNDVYEKNMEFLKNNMELRKAVEAFEKKIQWNAEGFNTDITDNRSYQGLDGVTYTLEATTNGAVTLCVSRGEKRYYLHTNGNPEMEARRLIEEYYEEEAEGYQVFGLGLCYHVAELGNKTLQNVPIEVYEPDIMVILLALSSYPIWTLGENVTIHYDPDGTQFSEQLLDAEKSIIIHHPSLLGIPNKDIRDAYERFFIKDSSYRNQKGQLKANFKNNIRYLEQYPNKMKFVQSLENQFKGRDVFIVAAGPSLDKNLELLRSKPDHSIILATGTVFYKMLKMGIRPDYVIVTDANERVISQIREYEGETIPMLLLSTANRMVTRKYAGNKYLILQRDYKAAEDYADKKGLSLNQTGGSVSTTALDVAISLKAGRIIFLGLDLAYTDNLAHAEGTSNRVATGVEQLIPVKGFYGDIVYEDQKFIIYREWIEKRLMQPDARNSIVMNATEGGSYIKGMKQTELGKIVK